MGYEKPLEGRRGSLAPWIKDDVKFYPHQIEGIRTLARWKSFILADDMGLGKTLQSLVVFGMDVFRGWAKTAIVVCPVSLKANWAEEIELFTGFDYMILEGGPAKREEQLAQFAARDNPRILVMNYEQVGAHLNTLNSMMFDVSIFDEAHYLKNPKSQRTKACQQLFARRSFLLTGTPMLNKADELWSLLHRIDPDAYPNYWTFVNRYCVMGGYKDKQIIGVKNEKELTERVQRVMLRRLKKDVLDLPTVQIIKRYVDLTPEQRKIYDMVANELKLERTDSEEPDDIENALTKFLRLKQICGTTLPFTGVDHSAKLDLAVDDDLEILANGHKIVVFTQFRDVQDAYCQRIAKATGHGMPVFTLSGQVSATERQGVVNEWKNVSGPAVINCMLQVAGVGLNMTAARHGSFLDELFVPGLNQQAIDRLNRIGASTTQAIQIRKYIARDTIESRIQSILRTKTKLFGEIVEADPLWKAKVLKAIREGEAA
jgi:SNF2 family DNA or RNA helicase